MQLLWVLVSDFPSIRFFFTTWTIRSQEYVQGRKEGWLQNDGNSVKYIAQHGPLSQAIL